MINHNHSFLRMLIDTVLVIILLLIIISPVVFIISLKINNLNLQAKAIEVVAGANTKK